MDIGGRSGEMEVFTMVAEHGSLSGAARALGLTPSAISRIITRTEQRIGTRLLLRTTRALAAFEGAEAVTLEHLRRIAPMALRHRLRRNVLDDAGSTTRVERAVAELWDAPAGSTAGDVVTAT